MKNKLGKTYHVPKPKKFWTLNRIMTTICWIGVILSLVFVLSSCGVASQCPSYG